MLVVGAHLPKKQLTFVRVQHATPRVGEKNISPEARPPHHHDKVWNLSRKGATNRFGDYLWKP